jgi:hypothetical protein
MVSTNTLTGRGGSFTWGGTTIARVTNWDVNPTLATTNEWGDSDSSGFTNRSAGRKDATFNTEGKYDSTSEVFDTFQPEDIAAATLVLVTATFWNFPRALCTDFNMTVNIDTEEVIGWTASHGADGTYTIP